MTDQLVQARRRMLESHIRQQFEISFPARVDRAVALIQHQIVPHHHFTEASAQCIYLWRDGYFLAVIMMTQAIVEGVCRFVLERNSVTMDAVPPDAVEVMLQRDLITPECGEAICRIWKSFRNDVHHMNPKVAEIQEHFHGLAERNIKDLQTIEREIFGFDIDKGKLRPRQRKYWDVQENGTVPVFLRSL